MANQEDDLSVGNRLNCSWEFEQLAGLERIPMGSDPDGDMDVLDQKIACTGKIYRKAVQYRKQISRGGAIESRSFTDALDKIIRDMMTDYNSYRFEKEKLEVHLAENAEDYS